MTGVDARWMQVALGLGARGAGRVWPNPAVGCVIVKDGRVLGRGWTQPGGRPHGETGALAQAGSGARGATVYVTLEPCAHFGKTPPCAEALIDAGVAHVVIALTDPDPRTNGGGIVRLKQAGIAVTTGVLEDEARRAHRGFLTRVQQGRPALTLKLATSFDGRIATATGQSKWITGPDARRYVHAMRARHDAVLVGAGTARADDPALTVRGLGMVHQPVRLVVSRKLNLPQDGVLARSAQDTPLWLICSDAAPKDMREKWQGLGARCLTVPVDAGGQIDLADMFRVLGDKGLTRVFCEGGGTLAASLLSAGLVDDLVGFTAGLAIGAEGRPAIGAMGLEDLSAAPRFVRQATRVIGADIMHEWARAKRFRE